MTHFKAAKQPLPVLTYIDRDNAYWKVERGTWTSTGDPVIRVQVTEEGSSPKAVIFHKDDAEMIGILINAVSG